MQSINSAFERHLSKLIAAEIEGEKENMAGGLGEREYLRSVGKVAGFQDVLNMFDEVNKLLDER